MSGRRVLALYAALLFGFAGVLCRLFYLASRTDYAARAAAQSTVTLELPVRRGGFYDCMGLPLTGLEKRWLALCFPGQENYTRLYACTDTAGQELLYRSRSRAAPFLVEVDRDMTALGIPCYAASRRYAAAPLCPQLLGYLDGEGHGAAGLEKALDALLTGSGARDTLLCPVTAQGTLRTGMAVRLMSTGAQFNVVECGVMGATNLVPRDQISAGEVGYFTASIKTVADTRVGDTVTGAENPAPQPLPGYRSVNPMVFCGIYPADGAKYPDLREALEKLQLNDAALSYEPETSAALGFGFRCGFLGLLHMEIIQERLEREFNLDLITTAPSVIYHLTLTDGTKLAIDNPTNYPDPSSIAEAEEPYVRASIFTPPEYIGALMDLCQQRRGIYKDTKYLDPTRVELHYDLPLAEIIYDFFDALKSRSRGYASLDYELSDYRPSRLVKLDILLNGEMVDALSFIVFADNAYPRARRLAEKLKDHIPRQLFEIPIQAAVGGKIIARETVKAMRKDVLAKCYGGDITRKKKLLEKQKEGKKRMRQLGSVEVPQEAFMAVLKLDE